MTLQVCSTLLLWLTGTLPPLIDSASSSSTSLSALSAGQYLTAPVIAFGPLDLSRATKLNNVKLMCTGSNVQWITTTLRTAKSTNLQNITITIGNSGGTLVNPVGEATSHEWQDLDHLLDHLWTSRLICPNIRYAERGEADGFGELVSSLLPKLAGKGVVNRVGW